MGIFDTDGGFGGGIFGDLDLESASDNPFGLPNDKYEFLLTGCEYGPTNKTKDLPNTDPEKRFGITWTFTVTNDCTYKGQTFKDWIEVPQTLTKDQIAELTQDQRTWRERNRALLKRRLVGLGVPLDRMSKVQPSDLIGTESVGELRTSKRGQQIMYSLSPHQPSDEEQDNFGLGTEDPEF